MSLQVCFYVIKYLLVNFLEFKTRVKYFVSENPAQHWRQTNLHEKHLQYHEKFPERFYFEGNNLLVMCWTNRADHFDY